MRLIYTLTALLFFCFGASAQTSFNIVGTVKNSDGKLMDNASVLLIYKSHTDTLKTMTNEKGKFIFKNVQAKNITILVSYIGYKSFSNQFDFSQASSDQSLQEIVLFPGDKLLEEITLESNKVQIKEDTVTFLIDSTMYRKNDNVEEVLKKLPGIQVDKDGNVTAQGKQVTKVKVNGKEFFGGDVTTATREINADMVDRLQVIDDFGDQSAFTGIRDGDPSKTLNIQLKKDKNKGYFGNATAGAGTEGRYLGSVSVNKFNNNQQISVLGNLNNTNASTFNFGSMGGAIGNMVGGMVRSLGIGKSGSAASALGNFGNSDGISTTKSIGLNYRDEWGPKVSAYGSYSFSRKATNTIREITQMNTNNNISNLQHVNDYTINDNHRFSFNLEYKIDSFNYIKFTPTVTYNNSTTDNFSDFSYIRNNGSKLNSGTTAQESNSSAPNLNANLLFNHRFHKRGRTLSVNLSAGKSSTVGDNDYENLSTYYAPNGSSFDANLYQFSNQDNSNHNYGLRASYIEPLSKKRSLEFNYAYNRQFTGNDKETFDVDSATRKKIFIDSLSNIYDNIYITNKFGVNFRTNEKKYNYTIGLAVQPASITSNSVTGKYQYTQQLVNYYPVIRFAYNFSRSRSFNVNYNGSTSQPSFNQLQPITDYSNPQYLTTGNPNLKPEFSNTLSMRYNNFDFITGNVFFSNVSVSFTKDKIVNSVFQVDSVVQETRYRNSDGFYTVFGFYNFSKPIQNRKFVFNYGGNITYNNNISYQENQMNTAVNWLIGQRFSTDVKIKKWLETTIGVIYSLNSTKNTLQSRLNTNTNASAWTLSQSSRFFLPYQFKFNYEIDKSFNSGYAANVNSDPLIINATLEKALFKKQNASLKLQAFDLLNENTNVNRQVTGSAITDSRTNRLGRYFMLSVVFRLNKFSGQSQGNKMMPDGNMPMMRSPGM